jgi:hypothetical protein
MADLLHLVDGVRDLVHAAGLFLASPVDFIDEAADFA